MSESILEKRNSENSQAMRTFTQEELILDVTESIWGELERKGWSKANLAEALGCTPAHVTQLLNGSRNMTLRTLADIAFALDAKIRIRLNESNTDEWKYASKVYLRHMQISEEFYSGSANSGDWLSMPTYKIAV